MVQSPPTPTPINPRQSKRYFKGKQPTHTKHSNNNRYRQTTLISDSTQFHPRHQSHNTVTTSNKQIIIFAGPSASGKSHLINRLLNDQNETFKTNLLQRLNLTSELKIGKLNIERLTNTKKMLRRSKKMSKDAYIVHFDLTSRNQRKRRKQLKLIASQYKHLVIITLELTFKNWKQQMSDRVKNKFLGMPLSQAFWIYALSLIHKDYAQSLFYSVYEKWDSFLDQTSINDRLFFNRETNQFQSKSIKQNSHISQSINIAEYTPPEQLH